MKKLIFLFLLLFAFRSIGQNHYVVTTTNDPASAFSTVSGELRWAIKQANAHPGLDYIDFHIMSASVPCVIQLYSDLPEITSPVIIDGMTQPAGTYAGIEPKICVKGNKNNIYINGAFYLRPAAAGSSIKNMTLYDYHSQTLIIEGAGSNIIQNCVLYETNSLSGSYLCFLYNSDQNQIKGNYFGTNRAKTLPASLSVKATGILFGTFNATTPDNSVIGGGNSTDANYFYNTQGNAGVDIQHGIHNKILNNIFINNIPKNIDIYSNVGCGGNICKQPPVYQATTSTVSGTSLANDFIEVYLSNAGAIDAVSLLGTTTANSSGVWSLSVSLASGDKVIATATDVNNNTSEFGPPKSVPVVVCPNCQQFDFTFTGSCKDHPVTFTNASQNCFNSPVFTWNYGDGSASSTTGDPHTFVTAGTYNVTLSILPSSGCAGQTVTHQVTITDCELPCTDCIGSFAPEAGEYILSAWVKEGGASPTTLTYNNPKIYIEFPNDPGVGGVSSPTLGPFTATGAIIDGWQRIEANFNILNTATYINLQLKGFNVDCYFDDIRIFPVNGSMKSYVYDPTNLRLVAELDERNYATMYEYDEEGKLIRVKKETEKGIMTIKENKNSTKKK